MPRTCTICNHKSRSEIDQALAAGESLRNIAKRFETTMSALKRHKDSHLPEALIESKHAEVVFNSDTIIEQMMELQNKTNGILDRALLRKDDRTAIQAVKEVRGNNELISKLMGQLKTNPEINVQIIQAQQEQLIIIVQEALRSELSPQDCVRVIQRIEARRQALIVE